MPSSRSARLVSLVSLAALLTASGPASTGIGAQSPVYVQQGSSWDQKAREAFYSQDQGSQLIPLAWLKALKAEDGTPFLGDRLARYGYLDNPASPNGLPVGFTTTGDRTQPVAGMTCAACHTREINVDGTPYRIDGGPAFSDFQAMLTDLVAAVGRVLSDDAAFRSFSDAVLGAGAGDSQRAALRQAVGLWHQRENAMVTNALPQKDMWGLGRLDAISMIYNRLSGLDIGPAPTYLIESNIKPANAPVRYPFIWNAPRQDRTQWPGFAANGDNFFALTRNLGEVYGVFGVFRPTRSSFWPSRIETRKNGSANFRGLATLEELLIRIGEPKWPWPLDEQLKARGKEVFALPTSQGGCIECHGEFQGEGRLFNKNTWRTPIQDVGTDSRQYDIVHRPVDSGILTGGRLTIFSPELKAKDEDPQKLLKVSVVITLLQGGLLKAGPLYNPLKTRMKTWALAEKLGEGYVEKTTAAPDADCNKDSKPYCYELRVLRGIWAAAPYLHNGSVPTLEDLLKPVAERPASFAVGNVYDVTRVGLAAVQPGSSHTRTTTDCSVRDSGNSRCGHEFGARLSPEDKRALLEYLKSL